MHYIFSKELAIEIGVEAAIILENIHYWIDHNAKNDKHVYDGHVWTYNSIAAFREQFPFWSENTIRRKLDFLEKEGYIITGNYNKSRYDRTKWYALTDKSIKMLGDSIITKREDATTQNEHIEEANLADSILPKRANQNVQNEQMTFAQNEQTNTNIIHKNNQKNSFSETPKTKYAEFVSMTQEEHDKLEKKLGTDGLRWCIEKLDNFKGQNGKKYKSDYRAILNWVVDEWDKRKATSRRNDDIQTFPEVELSDDEWRDILNGVEQ